MSTAGSEAVREREVGGVFLHIQIHPELRKEMRIAAARADMDMFEWLHRLLCGELDRLDLLQRLPQRPPVR